MFVYVTLERIGRANQDQLHVFDRAPNNNPWIARLTDCSDGRFAREFLPARIQYAHTNRQGTRGVHYQWLIDALPGEAYELWERVSWSRTDRRYAHFDDGREVRITWTEACRRARNRSASTS